MSDPTTSGASTLENVSISGLAKHIQSLSHRVDDLEQEVAEKDERINELEQRVDDLEEYREESTKERAQDRQNLSGLGDTTESMEADIDDPIDAEGKNNRVQASVSRIINLVRDTRLKRVWTTIRRTTLRKQPMQAASSSRRSTVRNRIPSP